MKPVKKDQPRQARRERTLARLEKYLKGGVKKVKVIEESLDKNRAPGSRMIEKTVKKTVAFEDKDIKRIEKEIATLKTRLGR